LSIVNGDPGDLNSGHELTLENLKEGEASVEARPTSLLPAHGPGQV
jgi:hypothetical protein